MPQIRPSKEALKREIKGLNAELDDWSRIQKNLRDNVSYLAKENHRLSQENDSFRRSNEALSAELMALWVGLPEQTGWDSEVLAAQYPIIQGYVQHLLFAQALNDQADEGALWETVGREG